MPQVTVVDILREVFTEGFDEGLVVFRGVELFCAEKRFISELPCTLQHLHIEESLVLGGDVFKECEDCSLRMLVTKRVEDKALFGYESVPVSGNPVSC